MSQTKERTSNLGDAIANYDGHLVFASRTGSGKTTILLASIAYIDSQCHPHWLVASGKASNWMGLENLTGIDGQSAVITVSMTDVSTVELVLKRMRFAVALSERREQKRVSAGREGKKVRPTPVYVILDEWLILLKAAKKLSKDAYAELIDLAEILIYKGRQDKVFLWIAAQGHHCGTLNISGDTRINLGVVALGGDGNYQSLESAIADNYLIESDQTRSELNQKYRSLIEANPIGRYYYTSIRGHSVGRTPQLPDMEQVSYFEPPTPKAESKEPPDQAADNEPVQAPPEAGSNADRDRLEENWTTEAEREESSQTNQSHWLEKEAAWHVQGQALWLQEQALRLQVATPEINAEQRWNLTTLIIGLTVFSIYIIPPFSGFAQGTWQAAGKVGQAIGAVNSTVGSLGKMFERRNPLLESFAPALQETPTKGETIAGYQVTSPWGNRDTGIEGASKFHRGVDLGTPTGTPVFAIGNAGEDVDVDCHTDQNGGGLVATVSTPILPNRTLEYLHLDTCTPGKVKAGVVIAKSGSSGIGSSEHLHFQQRITSKKGDENNGLVPPQKAWIWWSLTGNKPESIYPK